MKSRRNGARRRPLVSAASRRKARKRSAATAPPRIAVIVASALWKAERGVRAVVRRAVVEAAAAATTNGGELAIVLTDDSAIRALNRDWRGQDRPTNVLSFPAHAAAAAHAPAGPDRLLGDIVIAYETTAREARAEHRLFAHHLAHLAVHGFLHLIGHDHAADAEAEAMEAIEVVVLARLKVPNPYLAPDC
jgi:probable rRNA maturation factor